MFGKKWVNKKRRIKLYSDINFKHWKIKKGDQREN